MHVCEERERERERKDERERGGVGRGEISCSVMMMIKLIVCWTLVHLKQVRGKESKREREIGLMLILVLRWFMMSSICLTWHY